jgi:hypothetical protein
LLLLKGGTRRITGQRPAESVGDHQRPESPGPPGRDQEPERAAHIVDDHRDVLQIEGVDEPLEDLGAGPDAVVVARRVGGETTAREVEGQATELRTQAHYHVAEHERPLPGTDQQQAGPEPSSR